MRKIVIVVVSLAIIVVPAVISAFRLQTVLSTEREPAIVTDCRSFKSARVGIKYHGRTYHAPVAVSESGATAIGTKRLSERSWCENMVGQKTTVFVHATEPDKNRIGSYLQFWLEPSLLFFGLCLVFIPVSVRHKIMMGIGFMLLTGGGLAREFGLLGINSDTDNIVLSSESRLDRCIDKWLTFKNVASRQELTKLTCERVDDLSSLNSLPNLEELFIHRSSLTSLDSIPVLPSLKSLRLEDNKALTSLAGIHNLENLEVLDMSRNALMDIAPLASMSKLISVSFYRETFKDISPLEDKMSLQRATFNVSQIEDLSPLYGKPALVLAGAIGDKIDCRQVNQLKSSLQESAKVWVPDHCK